jgi:hypothetical protein
MACSYKACEASDTKVVYPVKLMYMFDRSNMCFLEAWYGTHTETIYELRNDNICGLQ